jgi:hypothetical protein
MSRIMNKIILSSGIEGIDWRQSINLLVGASSNMSHFDNVMLNTKGKYDDFVFEKVEVNAAHEKLKPQLKSYLTHLLKNDKSLVSVLSDPIFMNSGAAMQTLNRDKTFAFFFCSPEYYLANMEDATDDGKNIDQQECLDNWLEGASKIWEFYVCYPDSTLLINIEDVAREPRSNASKVFEFLGCELYDIGNNQAPKSVNTAMVNSIEKLSLLLLQNMKLETIKASRELNELYENLAATSILSDSTLSYDPSERAGIRLSECQKLIAVIATRQLKVESDAMTISSSNEALMVDNAKLKAEFTARTSAFDTSLSELTSESELALLQINQLQEELEATYLNSEKDKANLVAGATILETQITKLTAENELAAVKINQQQKELQIADSNSERLNKESASLKLAADANILELTSESELALLQINQLQEELEATYLNSEKDKANLVAGATELEAQITKLTAENKLAAVKINQQQEELQTADSTSKERNGESAIRTSEAEASILELTTVNELKLLQINQLQEELEHYYVQYQKMSYSPQRDVTYGADLNRVKHSLSLMN